MSSRELGPEWVLSRFISPVGAAQDEISELVVVARRLWPRIQVHARREQPEKNSDEALVLATEAYLFGAFYHRFNRALKKERRRREIILHLPSSGELERLRQAHDSKVVRD